MAAISEEDLEPEVPQKKNGALSEDDLEQAPGAKVSFRRAGDQKFKTIVAKPAQGMDFEEDLREPTQADDNPLGFLRPTTKIGAAVRGGLEGASLGFSGEGQGVIGALADTLTGNRPDASFLEKYAQNRDEADAENKAAHEANPGVYNTSEIAAAFAVPVPGAGAAKGAKTLKGLARVAKAVKTGAKLGGIGALGHSEGNLIQSDNASPDAPGAGRLLADALIGTGGGAVLGGAMGVGHNVVDAGLRKIADSRAYKALDPYVKTMWAHVRNKLGREPSHQEVMDELRRTGRVMLDNDIIPQGKLERWTSSDEIARRAARARDDAGQKLGGHIKILEESGQAAPVSMEELARRIEAKAIEQAENPAAQSLARNLLREAQGTRQAGVIRGLGGQNPEAMTLTEAEKLKRQMQNAVFGVDAARRGGPTQEAKRLAAQIAKQLSEEAIEKSGGPDEVSIFKTLKNKYGDLDTIADTAGYGAERQFRNNVISLGDQQLAQVGAQLGEKPIEKGLTAAGMALANKLGRERGSAAAARTLDNLSKQNKSLGLTSLTSDKLRKYYDYLTRDDGEQ